MHHTLFREVKMSDYDDDFMAEDEDYDLEYSEDSNRCGMCFWKNSPYDFVPCSEPDVDLENQYYNSKSLKEKDPKAALESFQRVLDLENGEKGMFNINIIVRDQLLLLPPGEWGFKALKQMIKINFRLSNFGEMMTRYDCLFAAHVLAFI